MKKNKNIIFLILIIQLSQLAYSQKYFNSPYTNSLKYLNQKTIERKYVNDVTFKNLRSQDICEGLNCSKNQVPLSINIVFFEAKRVDGDNVKLVWEVSSQNNIQRYEIERSFDNINEFKTITYLHALDGASKLKYENNDLNNFSKFSYYRLKIIENNGKYNYSNIISVNGIGEFQILKVFPNPVDNSLIINTLNKFNNSNKLEIIDEKGNLILMKYLVQTKGENTTTIDTSDFTKGIYLVIITSKTGEIKVEKIIK